MIAIVKMLACQAYYFPYLTPLVSSFLLTLKFKSSKFGIGKTFNGTFTRIETMIPPKVLAPVWVMIKWFYIISTFTIDVISHRGS